MIEILLPSLTIITLAIASYTDLRTREVPDWISYAFLFSVIAIRAIYSTNNINILLTGLAGLAIAYVVGAFLYYTHQWGGADSKLLLGVGVVIGISHFLDFTFIFFLISLLFFGAIYSLIWMIFIALKNKKEVWKKVQTSLKKQRILHYTAIITTILLIITTIFIPITWPFIPFPLLIFYLFTFISAVERANFTINLPLSKITEGDWLAQPIRYKGKAIVTSKTVTENDLKIIQKHNDKIDFAKVKQGVPFVPSFLIAYLFIFFGEKMINTLLQTIV